jgi:uncharacterized membrane protein YqjE
MEKRKEEQKERKKTILFLKYNSVSFTDLFVGSLMILIIPSYWRTK